MKELPISLREELTNYYKTAEKYAERLDAHDASAYQEYANFVKRFAKQEDRILDLGCGPGLPTFLLSSFAKEVVGLDISPIFIRIAKEKHSAQSIKFMCGDILNLPFSDGSFDVVSSYQVIEHVCEVGRALAEMTRVVKTKGLVIILSPNLISPFSELHRLRESIFKKKNRQPWEKEYNPFIVICLFVYKAAILLVKCLKGKDDFCYRVPVLENKFDLIPDNDAVYFSNPLDLKFWFKNHGLEIIKYQHETKWGKVFPCFATGIHIVARKL